MNYQNRSYSALFTAYNGTKVCIVNFASFNKQNDVGNKFSPTVIAAAITSQKDKNALPTHIEVDAGNCGLAKDSVVLLEQVRTIDKRRLKEKMGSLDNTDMGKVDHALTVSFGL